MLQSPELRKGHNGFYVYGVVGSSPHSTAIGNLAVVIRGQGVLSTDEDPIRAATPDLWCEARKDGEVQPITWARFFRVKEKKAVAARLDPNNRRARLIFGNATASQAGKYRCEIRTEDGELVFGNMFAYSRPVIHGNASDPMEVSPSDPTLVTSGPLSFPRDSNATIHCPVYAYPHPHIVWYKDGIPLESSARVNFHKNAVEISGLEDTDAGMYRCVASNEFPIYVDGPEQEFEVKFDRELKIGGTQFWEPIPAWGSRHANLETKLVMA
ncbi:immunoglobulin domain protein [Teladorsagia circumcincta]|uniref:Immunoglobulin domain protein n=1 Tax=Teladorsagia circumcincta TaxID=45464 RepID=A0A2G9U0D2_TELCI|nr:immunoglobulin domain protein [Teladorsagia circumcincta]